MATGLYSMFKGARVNEVVRALAFRQYGPGSVPGLYAIRGLSLLVLYSTFKNLPPGTFQKQNIRWGR